MKHPTKSDAFILVILLISFISSCSPKPTPSPPTATPTFMPTSTPTPTVTLVPTPAHTGLDGLRMLLEYIPYEWAEEHPDEPLGPYVHFLDIARVREDLELAPVSGTDDRKAKLGLITGMNTQGAGHLFSSDSTFFDEWGWDVADVDQMLSFHEASILLGNFGRPEIKEQLLEKGYSERTYKEFTIFTSKTEEFNFAFGSDDTIIVANSESVIVDLVQQKTGFHDGADIHPSVAAVIEHLEGAWGAFLAPSGNMTAFADRVRWTYLQLPDKYRDPFVKIFRLDEEPRVAWHFVAIGFWGSKDTTTILSFLYHYPSEEEAKRDVAWVSTEMTEMPTTGAPSSPGRVWGDRLTLQDVKVYDTVLQVTATTQSKSLIGSAITNQDLGFLPIRAVPMTTIMPPLTSTLESGWILYQKPTEGFAVALPPEWQQLGLDQEAIESSLDTVSTQRPELGEMFSSEAVRSLVARGMKFFAVDLSPDSWRLGVPVTLNIMKTSLGTEMSLDEYATIVLEQVNKLAAPETRVTHQRISLPNVEAEEIKYKMMGVGMTGESVLMASSMLVVVDGSTVYFITLATPSTLADTYDSVLEGISQSFRLLE